MSNEKSKTKIPPIPDGVRKISLRVVNCKTNESFTIEELDLFRQIKGSTFNSWKEDDNGEV